MAGAGIGIEASAEPFTQAAQIQGLIVSGTRECFEGDWGEAERTFDRLAALAPDHPAGAYWPVAPMKWRIALDPADRRYDEAMRRAYERTVVLAERRLDEAPEDPVALEYLGRALVGLSEIRERDGATLASGARGEDGRRALERAVEAGPQAPGATLPLGLYLIRASGAGLLSHIFSWLWFVPSGDAERGLALVDRASAADGAIRIDAERALVGLLAEGDAEARAKALELALSLHRRFPRNAVLHAELLETLLRLGRANEAVIETARIAERALRGDRNYGEDLAAIAAIGRARALLIQGEAGEADRLLDAFGDGEPLRPRWAYARVLLVRAQIRDFQGRRDEAVALYARVRDYEGPRRSEEAAEEAEIYLEKPFTPPRPS